MILFLLLLLLSPSNLFGREYTVTRVLDGDTIVIETNEIVRYIGVDAPELNRDGIPEFYAKEALNFNRKLVFLKKVRLEFDREIRDSHGRLLAYVFVKDLFVNAELVRLGFARAIIKPPNEKYKDLLLELQKKAIEKKLGLWQKDKEETASFYIGNKRSYVFHRPDCPYAKRISEKNRIIFRSRKDAIEIGYTPCRTCQP